MNKEFFISDEITQKIDKFDSIIFDCDGVLVDIRNSYDEAINKTISAIMKELFDDDVGNVVTSKIHFGLKAVGGFNDEVAVVYALVMTLVASKKSNIPFEELIIDVIKNANESVYSFGHKLAAGGRMASSLLGIVIEENTIAAGRVGAGSAYLYREGDLFSFFESSADSACFVVSA